MSERTSTQVQVIPYRIEKNAYELLALQRNQMKGGFWQPVTGGVETSDPDLINAAKREVAEEIGINSEEVTDLDYSFTFEEDGKNLTERVFTAQVPRETEITRSSEHINHLWMGGSALRSLVEWDDNKVAIDRATAFLQGEGFHEATNAFDYRKWSVVIVKPDAFEYGIQKEIHSTIARGLHLGVVATQFEVQLDWERVKGIWKPWHDNDTWWEETAEYMCRRPVDIMLVNGEDATQKLKEFKADLRKRFTRGDKPACESLMHCSDRDEELVRNSLTFWNDANLRELIDEQRQ